MAKPIGFFTSCSQAEALARRFGAYGGTTLMGLSQIDRDGLLCILAHFVYMCQASEAILPIVDTSSDAILPDDDLTTDTINEAIDLLEGITPGEALQLIGFLVQ